ncbi:MAG: hypothetical protein ACKO4Z_05255 [Planctomycetota bacterium]
MVGLDIGNASHKLDLTRVVLNKLPGRAATMGGRFPIRGTSSGPRGGLDAGRYSITAGDADTYKRWLLDSYAPASASVDLRRARQFLKAAVRRRLIPVNPFAEVPCGPQVNDDRIVYVSPETIEAINARIGNSARMRRRHYHSVRPEDWAAVIGKAAHIPAHATPVSGHQEPSTFHDAREKSLEFVKDAETPYPRQGSVLGTRRGYPFLVPGVAPPPPSRESVSHAPTS